MFANRVAMVAGGEGRPPVLPQCGTPNVPSSNMFNYTDLCAKHSCKKLAILMTVGSCQVKNPDTVGAVAQKMAVTLPLIAQYAGQLHKQ